MFYVIASNTESVAVPKNYGHSTNAPDSLEGYNEGNPLPLNNGEEPVPPELQPTPIPTQVSIMHGVLYLDLLIKFMRVYVPTL